MKGMLRAAVVVALASPGAAPACSVCFGAKGDPVTEAAGAAILFLLAVVACVLGGIVAFAVRLAARSRQNAEGRTA